MTAHQLTLLAVIGIAACWGALALAWLLGAIYYESRAPAERKRSWFGTAVWPGLAITAAVTFAVPRADWNSVVLHPAWARILGLPILVAATAFAIWARIALGAIWSAAPTVLEEHQLRTSGPYSVTRHPIYTGMLAMLAGTTLLAGGGRWIVAFPVFLVLVEVKLHIEERFMLAEFPDDYRRYRKRVPQLVPGLRLFRNGINRTLIRPEPPDNYNGRAFYSGPPLSDMLVIVHFLWPRFYGLGFYGAGRRVRTAECGRLLEPRPARS
jgi:protein-S-isoprenylcysteine O-methyltransferase Ste14